MKEKINTKSFIQTPLLIAIVMGVLIIGGTGYVGVKQYQNYQAKKTEETKQIQEKEQLVQANLKTQQEQLEKAQKEIEALKEKQTEQQAPAANKKVEEANQVLQQQKSENTDLSSVINRWKPLVAYIECDFFNKDNSYALSQAGSGTLFLFSDGIGIQTNKHVISKELTLIGGLATPDYCKVKFIGNNKEYYVYHHTESGIFNMQIANDESDGARLIIREPDSFIWDLVSQQGYYCKRKPSLGESIVILGYPSIGSKTDITATEGIISGYDYSVNSGNYYITSAKVEYGNSGGASILVKDNCWLGIPTFAQVGEIESLARILDEPGLLK